jgi:hypothetical protein
MGDKRNEYRIFVGKPKGKRPPGRPRRTWMDILKWILRKIGLIWLRIRTSGGFL